MNPVRLLTEKTPINNYPGLEKLLVQNKIKSKESLTR